MLEANKIGCTKRKSYKSQITLVGSVKQHYIRSLGFQCLLNSCVTAFKVFRVFVAAIFWTVTHVILMAVSDNLVLFSSVAINAF